MFKKLGITGLVLASVMAVAGPQVASARDRDDVRNSRDARVERVDHDRADWRGRDGDHDRDRDDRRFYNGRDYGNGYYANGYYDAAGCWHAYR
jgi:hypothetical protein